MLLCNWERKRERGREREREREKERERERWGAVSSVRIVGAFDVRSK